jgi:AAA domain
LIEKSEDMAALMKAVEEQRPVVIFLDTLAMCFPGLEENTAEAMGRVVKVARELTKFGAAVVLVHHDTKDKSDTPRGHSLLNGALDMAIHLTPGAESNIVRCRLTKNRNGTCARDMQFRIEKWELGDDDDGDPITAAVAVELDPGSSGNVARLTPSEQSALHVLTDMPEIKLAETVSIKLWRDKCIDGRTVSGSETEDSRRTAMDRAVKGLAEKGRIEVTKDTVKLKRQVSDDVDDSGNFGQCTETFEDVPCPTPFAGTEDL